MRQYSAIKAQYPGAVLLFRMGDFYETFGEDAIEVARILGIVLTKRSNGAAADIELAGFPHHSLDTYLPRLVRAGKRVAVCEQLEDPKQAKGIVKRGVTELVSPGVTFNDKVLEVNKHNYLACVWFPDARQAGVAFVEVSTGDFFCFSGDYAYTEKILNTLSPAEVLVSRRDLQRFKQSFGEKFYLTRLDEWIFQYDFARERLLGHFRTQSLKGFGIEDDSAAIVAAGAALYYLSENQQHNLGHINQIYRFDDSGFVWLDQFTVRNLELLVPLHPDGKPLVEVLDQTLTPMGARLLRRSLLLPLKDLTRIAERLDSVSELLLDASLFHQLSTRFRAIGDLERLASKVATQRLNPREATTLRDSLAHAGDTARLLAGSDKDVLQRRAGAFADPSPALQVLRHWLADEAGPSLADGEVIRSGVSEELDELRALRKNSQDRLVDMQQREVQRTGISSLKISYNKVFGYYLEVTHAHKTKVPDDWIRKQTLTNAERYITPELKVFEDKILNAEERIMALEAELYGRFLGQMQHHLLLIQQNALQVAELDMLMSFARVAQQRRYVRPEVNDSLKLEIKQGRHPVIETLLPPDQPYVPNDVLLDHESEQMIILTGPNMAGKSALLRQTALITLMAQTGSFVPADSASVGMVDKIFTRVGASDNLSGGESTFMVEMNETAQIANNATERSLVLLDEIGRGTSTYDGVSIAWALAEFLHETPGKQARTLFATHYHELNELARRLPRVRNYHVAVKESEGRILFLRTLKPGGSEHSFGIHVAEMAGMPSLLVKRARQLLEHFEQNRVNDQKAVKSLRFADRQAIQLNMFELKDADTLKIRQILSGVDIERMTPVEALLKLQEIKQALTE
ncbi:MAG: DNA mismatch repair protein MutS [Bacteroidetes bacterium]|nr:MAG: DNA mismatch repair protein MutS [Bacteroidota bacterium]